MTTSSVTMHTDVPAPNLLSASWIIAGRTVGSWPRQIGATATVWLFPVFTALLFLGQVGEARGQGAAGATPIGVEIDQDREV